jgi:hypothetical protein
MLMVGVDEVAVESDLLGGRLVCPNCDGELRPWWFARARKLRNGDGDLRIRPRRAICQGCRTTHVLLPVVGLLRRRDLAEVIGQVLVALAEGLGQAVRACLIATAVARERWTIPKPRSPTFYTALLQHIGCVA